MGAAFGSFVDGLFSGAKSMMDLRKQKDDLQTQLDSNQLLRQYTQWQMGQSGNWGKPGYPGGPPATTTGTPQAPFTTPPGTSGPAGPAAPGSTGGPTTAIPDPSGGMGGGGLGTAPTTASVNPTDGQLYDYIGAIGGTNNEAALLTAQARQESNFNANATHDPDANGNPVGYGLWGHQGPRLQGPNGMYKFAGLDPNAPVGTPVDWHKQAEFALNELRNRPEGTLATQATTPQQLAVAGINYEQPGGWTSQNPQAGNGWDQRLAYTTQYMQTPPHYVQPAPTVPPPGTTVPFTQQPMVTGPTTTTYAPGRTALAPPGEGGQPIPSYGGNTTTGPTGVPAPNTGQVQTVDQSGSVQPAGFRVPQPGPQQQPAPQAPGGVVTPPPQSALPSGQGEDVQWNPYGDSIALGFIESGYPGTYAASNGAVNTSQNAVGGRNPQQVLDRLNTIPTGSLKGAPVMLSSGASNVGSAPGLGLDAQHLALIDQQIKSLKRGGAGRIMLLGVGDHGGRETNGGPFFDLHNINPQLQQLARNNGVEFSGPLKNAVVHPSPGYYRTRFRSSKGNPQTAQAGP